MSAYPNAERYDVLQVDWGTGKGWQDFTTLKETYEFQLAKRTVETSKLPPGFPPLPPGSPIPRFRIVGSVSWESGTRIKYPCNGLYIVRMDGEIAEQFATFTAAFEW